MLILTPQSGLHQGNGFAATHRPFSVHVALKRARRVLLRLLFTFFEYSFRAFRVVSVLAKVTHFQLTGISVERLSALLHYLHRYHLDRLVVSLISPMLIIGPPSG
jgi:hypothetical protein